MAMTDHIDKHKLILFVALTYGMTWVIVLPLVLEGLGLIILNDIWRRLHYLAPAGPALASLIVVGSTSGRNGIAEVFRRMTRWRVGSLWLLISVGTVWVFYFAAGVTVVLTAAAWPDISLFGTVRYFPYLTFIGAWILWIVSFGLGEETGWRGFLLPHLQSKYNALKSAILLSFAWAAWHTPFFFYDTNFQAMGPFGAVMWMVGLMFGSILLTWLYNSTGGSILAAALWHGTYNLFTAAEGEAVGEVAPVITMLIMVLVIAIVAIRKPENLSTQFRQVSEEPS